MEDREGWPTVGRTNAAWPTSPRAAPWEPRLAGWRRRAAGFLIDLVVAWTLPLALFIAVGVSAPPGDNNQVSAQASVFVVALLVTSAAAFVGYPVWFIGRRGQTPGMRMMCIRLYRYDDEMTYTAPGYRDAWERWIAGAFLFALFLVGGFLDYIAPLWDNKNRCFHDMAAETIAVDEREA